jgi:hypothetical protein
MHSQTLKTVIGCFFLLIAIVFIDCLFCQIRIGVELV